MQLTRKTEIHTHKHK